MSESNKEKDTRLLKELEGKNIAHYSIMLSAWVQTRMERDKTLVALSAAFTGLLITILTTIGVNDLYELGLVFIAFIGFGTCIFSSLTIYQLNAEHIENELRGKSTEDLKLEKFDKLSINSLRIGVLFFILFGFLNAINFITNKEVIMSNNSKKMFETSRTGTEKLSVSGIGGLKPSTPSTNKGASNSKGSGSQSKSGSRNKGG